MSYPALLQAILADIRENPGDDGVRLVCADWIEEQGDLERAEFIRVQVALARGGDEQLLRRQRALLDEHYVEWLGPLWRWNVCPEFRRGFVEEVEVRAAHLPQDLAPVFALHPLRRLRLHDG